jgi:hypothetical protein
VLFRCRKKKVARPSLRDALQAKFEELHKAGSFPDGTAGFARADGTGSCSTSPRSSRIAEIWR